MAADRSIVRIVVEMRVGADRMAATDDPVFLGLRGPSGREFRLAVAKGKSLRRKGEDEFVFGAQDDGRVNVAEPQLNDPTQPMIDGDGVASAYIIKRLDAFPNVRGVGELDDRLQLESATVSLEFADGSVRRFHREGPIWLGLTCGLRFDLPPAAEGS